MKIKNFYDTHAIDHLKFDEWLDGNEKYFGVKVSSWNNDLSLPKDVELETLIADFRDFENQKLREAEAEKIEAQRRAEEEVIKKQALASMLVTSGFNFDGFSITKYSGYISGDDVVQIDRGRQGFFATATDVGSSLMENLVVIRRNALNELKEAAYALGCNAVIGVDFDYLTLDPETVNSNGGTLYLPYVFGVTANGNAVVIEKNKKASI